jgi:hypothetical protein
MRQLAVQIPAARLNGITGAIEVPLGDLISGQMLIVQLDISSNNAMTVVTYYRDSPEFSGYVLLPRAPRDEDDDDDPRGLHGTCTDPICRGIPGLRAENEGAQILLRRSTSMPAGPAQFSEKYLVGQQPLPR